MAAFYARSVFFVRDAPRALAFYTDALGFALDWIHEHEGRPYVVQVSLFGFELILNQTDSTTGDRAGHGRVFIGLDAEQAEAFARHVDANGIEAVHLHWGSPTIAIYDRDGNELFFWLPEAERLDFEARRVGAA